MSRKAPPRLARTVWIVVAICCAGFCASIVYFLDLTVHSPRKPIATAGQIYELNNHGSVVYVRYIDWLLAQSGFVFIPVAMLSVVAVRLFYGEFPDEASVPKKIGLYTVLAVLLILVAFVFRPWLGF